MAHYLPVLLVSVTTNSVPDDSSVSTLPRAQVDYLSHEWQEEDVWKSWRNMTKQKNEIANGVRLENASWRTWWKQRNKLKTVTPETLNWLKDSDVTWLYGPLHTAVDWAPPPRPPPSCFNADSASHPNNSPQAPTLDFDPSSANLKHKPILKHRSISELLTSDLPASPLFSPAESEDEESGQTLSHHPDLSSTHIHENDFETDSNILTGAPLSRPRLMHTKSDTHVTRWGPSRAFRKASPPRIDPSDVNSGLATDNQATSMTSPSAAGSFVSGSCEEGSAAPPLGNSCNVSGSHLSNDYASASSRHDEPTSAVSNSSSSAYQKKKHISFNTFVEQYIAIDKPKSESPRPFERPGSLSGYTGSGWEYDEGYDEDDEDGYSGACAIESDSDSDYDPNERHPYDDMNESAIDDDDEEDDDDMLHMRTPSSPKYNPARSKSKSSTRSSTSVDTSASTSTSVSNSTTSTSSSSSSSSVNRRIQRRNSAPTRRRASLGLPTGPAAFGPHPHTAVPMFRATSDSSTASGASETVLGKEREPPIHVTIAPIAPTFLKTSGMGDGEGEEDYPWNGIGGFDQDFGYGYDPFGWGSIHGGRVTGGGDRIQEKESGYNSTGAWFGRGSGVQKDRRSRGEHDAYIPRSVRAETPVELVYAPRVGNGYASRYETPEIMHREDVNSGDAPSPRRRAHFSVGEPDDLGEPDDYLSHEQIGRVTVTPASPTHSPSSSITLTNGVRELHGSALVTTPPAVHVSGGEGVEGGDPYDYFGGPDLGEDFSSTTSGGRRWTRKPSPRKVATPPEEDERGRGRERVRSRSRSSSRSHSESASLSVSRSRSRSRTPSPTFISSVLPSSASTSTTSPEQAPSTNGMVCSPGISPVSLPPKRANSFEVSSGVSSGGYHSTPSSAMLSPPLRGRPISNSSGSESRGRSVTRTPSSSFSDRDKSSCHGSPIGSLSPEGSSTGLAGIGVCGVYANGRVEREREVAKDNRMGGVERQRGRPRIGRNLSSSTSVSPVDYTGRDATSPSLVEAALAAVAGGSALPRRSDKLPDTLPSSPLLALPTRSSVSSSSSSSTVSEASSVGTITSSSATGRRESGTSPSVPTSLPSKGVVSPAVASQADTSNRNSPPSDSRGVLLRGEEGQAHESGTALGRAAGMLSSYLGLWPATGTA